MLNLGGDANPPQALNNIIYYHSRIYSKFWSLMAKPISKRCLKCSKVELPELRLKLPSCYKESSCSRKRSYYRNLQENRDKQLAYHRYRKFCGETCALCQSGFNLEVHHIKPQSRGGEDSWTNTLTLCHDCHMTITKYYRAVGWDREKRELPVDTAHLGGNAPKNEEVPLDDRI